MPIKNKEGKSRNFQFSFSSIYIKSRLLRIADSIRKLGNANEHIANVIGIDYVIIRAADGNRCGQMAAHLYKVSI